jgi:hypothetical protein
MRWLTIVLVVASLAAVGLGFTAALRHGVLGPATQTAPAPEPVLLIVMGHRENVAAVKRGLRGEPLLFDSPEALALERGRIVAARVEDASDVLNALGWADRPLEIVDPSRWRSGGSGRTVTDAEPSANGGATLAQLAKKPTLNVGEAIQALRLLR